MNNMNNMKLDYIKVILKTIKSNKNSRYKPSCNWTLELYDKRGIQNYLVVKKPSLLIILNKILNKHVLINAPIITKVV